LAQGASPVPGGDRSRRIWVNRTSGVAHGALSCRWLLNVPPDRLRVEDVTDWPPHRRLCPSCLADGLLSAV
jgi:hypothetical protein